ncbi:MAG: hypothetical protein VSS75_033085 [Candidatus Parabeggiatoa sp.]|nr:hypothetical protein [Candidatus Parabeggiatoa sp.]
MNYRKILLVFVISTTLLLNSCAAAPLMYTILVRVGATIAASVTGVVIEKLFDEFFPKEVPVRVDPNNPLIGYSNETMVFTRTEPPPPTVIPLRDVKMIRDSVDSDEWRMHPDEREKVDKKLSVSD